MKALLKSRKGFTLAELLITVAIVAILAAIAIPSYRYFVDRAKLTSSSSALNTVRRELEVYSIDKGGYPSSIDLNNFTDQNGEQILHVMSLDILKNKIYSLDQYTASTDSYTLKAKAMDSNHTVLTITPAGVTD